MPVVTIRGSLGSGAPEIGGLVAREMGGDYVDREVIARVAERLKLSHEWVAAREEAPSGIWGRIARALEWAAANGAAMESTYAPTWEARLDDLHYIDALRSVVKELALAPSIVIYGRGSQFILKDHPSAIHVLVVAPLELRVRRVMEALGLTREAASNEIERLYGSRRAFIRRYFGADPEDPVHYHLTVNTGRLSYDAGATLVLTALSLKRAPGSPAA